MKSKSPPKFIPNVDVLLKRATWATWISYLALLIIFALSKVDSAMNNEALMNGALEDGQGITFKFVLSGIIIWAVTCLPLLILLPGMIMNKARTYTWMSYVSLVYFILSVLLIFTDKAQVFGYGTCLASIGLYIGCVLHTRWYKRAEYQASLKT